MYIYEDIYTSSHLQSYSSVFHLKGKFYYGKCSKISKTLLFLLSTKMLVISAETHKLLVRIANREALIRLLLQKQSDLGLHCLSRSFCQQATSVQNFRTVMVIYVKMPI